MSRFYEVALNRPLRQEFTYSWAGEKLEPGALVQVPFGRLTLRGIVTQEVVSVPEDLVPKIRPIKMVEYFQPVLNQDLLELTKWMGGYYLSSWGEALFNALPNFPKKTISFDKCIPTICPGYFSKTLTDEQQAALDAFEKNKRIRKPFLIQGVAGSGKTEVYLRLADQVLKQGKSVIYLIPEISLVSQIKIFVEEVFPGQVVYFHSKQTPKERLNAWLKLKSGESQIVVGPRSALFAPLSNVGLIIMDEEHDGSYKQDETPRYHTFKTAWKRAELTGAHFVLGSATPSLEVLEDAKEGKIDKVEMFARIGNAKHCRVELVDMKRRRRKDAPHFSDALIEKIQDRVDKKEGTLIFLNRRGFSTQIKCESCGFFYLCPHCDVALTYHQEANKLVCHYCRYALKPAFKCPECEKQLVYSGYGTEKIQSELAKLFPTAVIERIDRETVAKRGNLDEVLGRFRNQEIDILIGTQMLTKGLDFKHLTLVGVMMAEGNLQLPDFRASERTYQLLEQVAGRSGRGELEGEVIIQTFMPEHYSIRAVLFKDKELYEVKELEHRKRFGYPPFQQMINLTFRGKNEKVVMDTADRIKKDLDELGENSDEGIEIVGPAPLPFYRLRGYFRWHIMIKAPALMKFKELFKKYLNERKMSFGVYMEIDVDPTQIL